MSVALDRRPRATGACALAWTSYRSTALVSQEPSYLLTIDPCARLLALQQIDIEEREDGEAFVTMEDDWYLLDNAPVKAGDPRLTNVVGPQQSVARPVRELS
jgi:hypothetical protein